jgi:hypothetical protein
MSAQVTITNCSRVGPGSKPYVGSNTAVYDNKSKDQRWNVERLNVERLNVEQLNVKL